MAMLPLYICLNWGDLIDAKREVQRSELFRQIFSC